MLAESVRIPEKMLASIIGVLPVAMTTTIVSPTARPRPIMAAEKIPADAVGRTTAALGVHGSMSESGDWRNLLVEWARQHELDAIVTAYAPVGPVAELLAEAGETLSEEGIELIQLRRAFDDATWPHAQRGFFKLKKQIPGILDELALAAPQAPVARRA